ncbi:MAG: caspase family protein [Chthoniobacterales bacterium]|nr:caspase family protein [Chthoniobacterales bacterium]
MKIRLHLALRARRGKVRFLAIAVVLGFGILAARAETKAFPPWQTWVFVAGLLEWQDKEGFGSFPQKNRQDARMVRFFREAGVPQKQIIYLKDNAATLKKLRQELKQFVGNIPPGGVLVFYYCGHGYTDREGGAALFAPWDAGAKGGWPVREVVDTVFDHFKGDRALLLADCCLSGGLVEAVAKHSAEVDSPKVAAVSSSSSREISTGDWTFTESFLDALEGKKWVDREGDGEISLQDFAENSVEDMRVFKSQRAEAFVPRTWPASAALSAATEAGKRVGERIEVDCEGTDYAGRIIGESGGAFLVRYVGFFSQDDQWVGPGVIRPIPAADSIAERFAAGSPVEIQWEAEWYPGRILEDDGGSYHVSYDGYGEDWNEWAEPKRVRRRSPS